MNKLYALGFAGILCAALMTTGCAKEGTCECTAVYSDNRPDSTWQEIRPNGNKDCTFIEGEEFYGNYSAVITCTKLN